MGRRNFSGREIVRALTKNGYRGVGRSGSHVQLRWEPPPDHETDARTVTVPMHDEVSTGVLRSIAEQAGANDFDEFCRWIDRNR
ncbi:type II toxin-antitoxin system HicA family toxin [Halolamina sp. C58]|uniref:type II toxin-antitoxin system HicA family toxin n=1 Tax=Halolamina sp. C58 TaxID=3421640 RepID=UPI003EBB349D